jgi:hypothetical protein
MMLFNKDWLLHTTPFTRSLKFSQSMSTEIFMCEDERTRKDKFKKQGRKEREGTDYKFSYTTLCVLACIVLFFSSDLLVC